MIKFVYLSSNFDLFCYLWVINTHLENVVISQVLVGVKSDIQVSNTYYIYFSFSCTTYS